MGAHVHVHYDHGDKFASIVASFFTIAVDIEEFTERFFLSLWDTWLSSNGQRWWTGTINLSYQVALLGFGCASHDLLQRQRHDAALCPQELGK
jgi:hypothetical protein